MGQEVLRALQRGWEEAGMLGSTSEDIKRADGSWLPVLEALEEGVLSGCYLAQRHGEIPEQKPGGGCRGMALSQRKQ